jgi:tetratricopeptide (TPR) repeat protein
MARYDRIAPLASPPRDRAFGAWTVLRDLAGRERDADLARRARLRFLALRPVRRLVQRGIENVPAESFDRQVEGVREELGHLPARDPERIRMAQYLHRIRKRTPLALTTATLDLGEVAEAARHFSAAEEFYRTALELADAYRLAPEQVIALRLLGRVFRKIGAWEEAERSYQRAAEIALRLDDRRQWGRALDGLGLAFRQQKRVDRARQIYETMLERGREWDDDAITAQAFNGLCLVALDAGDAEQALEHGWAALGLLTDPEDRYQVLGTLGEIFILAGLPGTADRCLDLAATGARRPHTRAQALLHRARLASDDGRVDAARDHLRDAIRLAKEHRHADVLGQAEELLGRLEREASGVAAGAVTRADPGDVARRIAAELESLGERLVPAAS